MGAPIEVKATHRSLNVLRAASPDVVLNVSRGETLSHAAAEADNTGDVNRLTSDHLPTTDVNMDPHVSSPEPPLWDRIQLDCSQETQKFSLQGLHRAETLFSIHPSGTATRAPSIKAAYLGNLIVLCIDKLLHIFQDGEHSAAVELDAPACCISIGRINVNLIIVAKRNGDLEVFDVGGKCLFAQRLVEPVSGQEAFKFLECSNSIVCLLTGDLKVHWFREKDPPTNSENRAADEAAGKDKTAVPGNADDAVVTDKLHSLLDISTVDLSERNIKDVSAMVFVEDLLIFSSGPEGILYQLDRGIVTRVWTAFPAGKIEKLLVGGDKRYLLVLSGQGHVAMICLRSFILIEYITTLVFRDIALSQTTEDGQVLRVQLIGLHDSSAGSKVAVYKLPSMELEYSVEVEGEALLAKHATPQEDAIVALLGQRLDAITVKSINESSPEKKVEVLLLKKRYQEAEAMAQVFKLPVQDIYLEELYDVLNQLGPNSDQGQDAAFERFLELYANIASPLDIYQAVISSLPARVEHTAQILDLLAKDLSRAHNGNGNSSQLADVVLSQYKLATFRIVNEQENFETWNRFLKTPTLELIIDCLRHNQLSAAFAIWVRHKDMLGGSVSSSSIAKLCNVVPSTADQLKKWLVEGELFQFVLRDFPERLNDLISKMVDVASAAEVREPATFPQASLGLLSVVQRELDAALSARSEESTSLPVVINAMKLFQGLKNKASPVHKVVTLRRDMEFIQRIRRKHNVELSLSEFSAESGWDPFFHIMDQLRSETELHSFTQETLKDYCSRKGFSHTGVLSDYITHLRSQAELAGPAEWESKACMIFKLLGDPRSMSRAALSMIEAASIPWKQCMNEVYGIATGMDLEAKEDLEKIKREVPLRILLRKHSVACAGLEQGDIIALLVEAGEALGDLLHMASKIGWPRGEILVEVLLKLCEEGRQEQVAAVVNEHRDELADRAVWARLQCTSDSGLYRGLPAALLDFCLSSCCQEFSLPKSAARGEAEPVEEVLSRLEAASDEEVFCELYLYCQEGGCLVRDLLYDLLVHAVQSSSPKVPLVASCFLRQEVQERECLLAVQYLLANYPAVQVSDALDRMLLKCDLRDSRVSLYSMWASVLGHFNKSASSDPFVCWKFSGDYADRTGPLPPTAVSAVNKLVNTVFDDSTREMSPEVWLDKVVAASKQCIDELQRVSATDVLRELLECVRLALGQYGIEPPAQVGKMVADASRAFIREHVSGKYTDLYLTAHVLASLGSELLVQYFQSMIAQSFSSTTMVHKLSSVGLLVSDMLQLPGKAHLAATLRASEWCLKVAGFGVDAQKILKEGFHKKNVDAVAEKLTQSTVMNMGLLRQFTQEFSLGSLSAYGARLFQHLVTTAAGHVHQGEAQKVYLELLPKADNVLALLSADEAREALQNALQDVDDYCYEVLQYIYEELVALECDRGREVDLLVFLKGYVRSSKVSAKERRQWTLLHPDFCSMPDAALRRLPLRMVLDKPQVALEAELHTHNIEAWVPVAHLLKLLPDDLRVLAMSNLVKERLQSLGSFDCQLGWVARFESLLADMADKKRALSTALHMFNDLPRGKTKVHLAQALWKFAEQHSGAGKLAQTFHSQFRALGCEILLRENNFEDSSYLKRGADPVDLANAIFARQLNTALTLEGCRVLPVVEQTATLVGLKPKELLARLLHQWIMKPRAPDQQAEVTAAFNFNQIMNAAQATVMDFDEVIKIVRLLVAVPDDTAIQLMSQFLALQDTASYGVDQQLRSTLAVLCAFDEATASSLLGESPRELSLQCNQLLYRMRARTHGVNLDSVLVSEELVCQTVGHLLQRDTRGHLILAFQLCRDFSLQDDATLNALVEAVVGRADVLEEAVLYLQRFKSVFGHPDYVQCWRRVVASSARARSSETSETPFCPSIP